MKKRNGFTMIELMMTIVLIALMATIVIVNTQGLESKQNTKSATKQITNIETAACSLIEQLNFNDIYHRTRDNCKTANNCNIPLTLLVSEGLIDEEENYDNEGTKIKDVKNNIIVEVRWEQNGSYVEKKCTCKLNGANC